MSINENQNYRLIDILPDKSCSQYQGVKLCECTTPNVEKYIQADIVFSWNKWAIA